MTDRRIAFAVGGGRGERTEFADWDAAFRTAAPDCRLVPASEAKPGDGIRYALAWRPVPGTFARLPDLDVVFSLTAGVEKILADPELPPSARVVKMAESGLTESMRQYVLWQVIHHHRRFWELDEARREARWLDQLYPPPWKRTVGLLGLGAIGATIAETLRDYQFDVRGWSRGAKAVPGVRCFAGKDGLQPFLDGLEILVCLLPLTPETVGILNADLFRSLAPGAAVINAARGGHLNEADLMAALASGQLSAASLDVTATEPLPAGHPFWRHPRIFLTPHCAGEIDPETGAIAILRQIERHEAGSPLKHLVDRGLGY